MKSTFPLVVFGGCLPEAAGGCFSIRTTNDNRAHLKLDYEAIFDKILVLKNNVFDRDARRSGPTNHFVGFQNPRFTQKFTRNALDWIR